jgi:hypothetical protein
MKGFLLQPKKDISLETVKAGLESLLGKGHTIFVNGSRIKNIEIMIKEGVIDKVGIYKVTVYFPKEGTVAIISEPHYTKLLNPATEKPVVPKSLDMYLADIAECRVEAVQYGAQG